MMSEATQIEEAALDQIIDKVLVLSEKPAHDDALIQRLQYDLAIKIHPPTEIARRYGFFDLDELREYLTMHPGIVENVKKIRALFESEEGIETRMRAKFQFATEALIPTMADLVASDNVPIAQRIDGFKQLQRGAGMDGSRSNADGPAGQRFVLNIMFGGDQNMRIAGVVPEDASTIPPPPQADFPKLSVGSEEPDEEADV